MEQQVMPVDVNKLKEILLKSRQVMNKVETGNFRTGNINAEDLVQETTDRLPDNYQPKAGKSKEITNITENMINNSKLPDAIKKAMLNNPIPQATLNHTFTLDDMEDMIEKPIPAPSIKNRQSVNENYQQFTQPLIQTIQQTPNISEDKIRGIVQEEMAKFFAGYFMKNMTETIQKQTIKGLIDNGVIKKNVINK
jgi:hypothetical protein